MVAVNIRAFRGAVPRVSERLQQPNYAARALNCKITSGKLEPLFGPLFVTNTQRPKARTIYRYRYYGFGTPLDSWFSWADDVDMVENPAANDARGRVYFTGENQEPRMTTYNLAGTGTPAPDEWYVLGVAAPRTAPTVVHAGGGSGGDVNRAYVYTFVTALGEESGPSPASAVIPGKLDGTWTISALDTPPPNSGSISAASANTPTTGQVLIALDTNFGLAAGEYVQFASVAGMTDLNGRFKIFSVVGTNQIVVELATAQTYTSGGTWTREAPHNLTSMVKRIYRTAGDEATFLFVAEVSGATTSYVDAVADTALGESLPTLNTLPPPKGLTCLKSLPNGCLVGLNGNEVCFSDPYMPYSWPLSNRYSFSGKGVNVVEAANSVIVLTENFPILFTGSDPEAMTPTTMETYAPCASKRGVVNVGGGAIYPSFDGLYLAAPGRVENLTAKLYREEEWRKLVPSSFQAAFYDSAYYGSYLPDGASMRQMWKFDPRDPDSVIEFDVSVDALYRNNFDGYLYLSVDGLIYRWDANSGKRLTGDWLSVAMQLAKPTNFAVAQIHAEFGEAVEIDQGQLDANELIAGDVDAVSGSLNADEILAQEINGSNLVLVVPPLPQTVEFTLYVDGQPIYSKQVTSSVPFRLPGNYLSEIFRVGLSASVPVYSFAIAQTPKELSELQQ